MHRQEAEHRTEVATPVGARGRQRFRRNRRRLAAQILDCARRERTGDESAKTIVVRALAAAAMPAMALAIFFTLSRGSILAAVVALAAYVAVTHDRTPRLLTLAIAGLGSAILIGLVVGREEIKHGLTN